MAGPSHPVPAQQPPVGQLAARLRKVYAYVVVAFLVLFVFVLAGVNFVLEKQREIEAAQRYARLALHLDTNLNRIAGESFEIIYNGSVELIPVVLAENESLVLDYQALLANADFEKKLNATETAIENQRALLKLRQELSLVMLHARSEDPAAAAARFDRGPRFQIRQLQDFVAGIVQLSEEYIDVQRVELQALEARLLALFSVLAVLALLLLAIALNRVGRATRGLERSLVASLEQVSREERLSTLGKVAGSISHELRNPLGTIRTSVFTLREKLPAQSPGVEKILARIERNIVRCDAIVSGLLDFVRQPQVHLQTGNLRDWLVLLLGELNPPEGVTLVAPDNDVGVVEFDEENLRRAVINICTNAYQAMAPFDVAHTNKVVTGQLRVSLERVGQRIIMSFQDTGGGIEAEHMERLFEPLFSTKTYGVGLGMSIVQQIMEQQGGGIDVTNEFGVGTTVTLWLPDLEALERVA